MATIATVNGVNNTKLNVTVPVVKIPVSEHQGRVRYMYDEYALAAADEFGAAGLIKCMTIPAGARLVDARVVCPDTGTGGVFEVGWAASATDAADPDGIFTSQDSGAAAIDGKMLSTVAGFQKTFVDAVEVQIDWTTATTDAGALTVKIMIWYVLD